MPVVDLYSADYAKEPDVRVYDRVPQILRAQAWNLVRDALGGSFRGYHRPNDSNEIYDLIRSYFAHDPGIDRLAGVTAARPDMESRIQWVTPSPWIDVVECSFRAIETFCGRFRQAGR